MWTVHDNCEQCVSYCKGICKLTGEKVAGLNTCEKYKQKLESGVTKQ